MHTFIRVVEMWVPSTDGSLLEFGGGLYRGAPALGVASRSMCFGRGEGLPGRAWDEARPIVLTELDPLVFRRSEQAKAAGLTCGIALPMFVGAELKAVLVLFCGDDDVHAGAIELWRHNPAESHHLALDDGYYGTTADVFEFISRRTTFHKGVGLPGLAWEAGAPVFLPDLGKGSRFLRADSATRVGINRGLAFPIEVPGHDHYVLALLSALATPLVRRFEVWSPAGRDGVLMRGDGFCEMQGVLSPSTDVCITPGQGAVGRAYATATPVLAEHAANEPWPAGATGWSSLVALPVLHQGQVTSVIAWYF